MYAEKITRKPYIPMLEENNIRQGFFEREDFNRLLAKLPAELQPVATLAYLTGWRVKSEILSLNWTQVDLETGTVRLYRGTTKNKDGRVVYLFPELTALFEEQWREHLADYPDCSLVFHRRGQPIKDFRGGWERACREASLSGKIPHDIVSAGDMKEAAEKMRHAFLGPNGHTFGHTGQFSEEKIPLSH